jgi:hypothetical protein
MSDMLQLVVTLAKNRSDVVYDSSLACLSHDKLKHIGHSNWKSAIALCLKIS